MQRTSHFSCCSFSVEEGGLLFNDFHRCNADHCMKIVVVELDSLNAEGAEFL